MTTATKKPKPKKLRVDSGVNLERLTTELKNAQDELAVMHRFLEKVQNFSDVVTDAKSQLDGLKARESKLKDQLSDVRDDIKVMRDLVNASNDSMLALIEPGPVEFMPLFDRMEKADAKTHGKDSATWREKPISVLRLSPVSSNLLIDADIVFIGQLQDRILSDDDWWTEIEGLTEPIAAAIADKLVDFAKKGGKS